MGVKSQLYTKQYAESPGNTEKYEIMYDHVITEWMSIHLSTLVFPQMGSSVLGKEFR